MNVFKDLWNDKPLFIAVVVGVLGLLYILYKKNSANIIAPAAVSSAQTYPAAPTGTFVEESYYNNVVTTTPTPSVSSAVLTIRNKIAGQNYDATHPGIPIRASAGGAAKTIGFVPWGSSITASLSGTSLGGYNFGGSSGSNLWIPYGGGYVSAYDVIDGTGILSIPAAKK